MLPSTLQSAIPIPPASTAVQCPGGRSDIFMTGTRFIASPKNGALLGLECMVQLLRPPIRPQKIDYTREIWHIYQWPILRGFDRGGYGADITTQCHVRAAASPPLAESDHAPLAGKSRSP